MWRAWWKRRRPRAGRRIREAEDRSRRSWSNCAHCWSRTSKSRARFPDIVTALRRMGRSATVARCLVVLLSSLSPFAPPWLPAPRRPRRGPTSSL